jgi:hypothetical protein
LVPFSFLLNLTCLKFSLPVPNPLINFPASSALLPPLMRFKLRAAGQALPVWDLNPLANYLPGTLSLQLIGVIKIKNKKIPPISGENDLLTLDQKNLKYHIAVDRVFRLKKSGKKIIIEWL